MASTSLFKEMYWACKAAEEEWRHNEHLLQMQLDAANYERKKIIDLCNDSNLSDSEIGRRLRIYYRTSKKE